MFGLNGFSFRKGLYVTFWFDDFNSSNLGYSFSLSTGGFYLSTFFTSIRSCSSPTDFFDPTDSTCKSSCNLSATMFQDSGKMLCRGCHYSCLLCSNYASTNCTSCNSTMFRISGPPSGG
jgi:hypothetical protein